MKRQLLVLLFLASCAFAHAQAPAVAPAPAPAQATAPAGRARAKHEVPPKELFEIERFVDGDTLWIRRKGEVEKLRLLSVDTEERLGPGHSASATKPQTVFGEETALWAEKVFKQTAKEGEKAKVGVVFPGGVESKDVYGRLLCHVLLPDGTDYNLLLVAEGKSPYFNKYGDDELCPEAFVVAQKAAREKHLGIWDPATNQPLEKGAPSAIRPYATLLPWWDARARAIADFRLKKKEHPEALFHAEDKASLEHAAGLEQEVEVFGEVEKLFDEPSGDATVLLRATERDHALRVHIPKGLRAAHAALDLEHRGDEFRQNYVYVRGRVTRAGAGYEMSSDSAARWRAGGPEPVAVPVPVAK